MRTLLITLCVGVFLVLAAFALAPFSITWPGWLSEIGQRSQGMRSVMIGNDSVRLLIAESDAERVQGLSGRATTSPAEGMLFFFPEDGRHGIWMKDMRFAIDILWLSAEGVVVDIKQNALPESFPEVFRPRELARYVIELPAGYAERLKVRVGSFVEL